ncbi:MAG: glycine--tRNA ligase subunit beta [Wolbachia endosymbiont of Fragariocoptes setiger]|nr:glycine--tRNA ligase subunit beta [Wolbachia endosymbiont of Fragariocoptes setiger]
MLAQLLFECLCEEIPSRMHNLALIELKNYVTRVFNKNDIKFISLQVFITARRISLLVEGIDTSELENRNREIKGPNINAPQDAIEGFLRKNKKNKVDLFVRKVNKDSFYFIVNDNSLTNAKEIIKNQMEEVLSNFAWPKSMRWGEGKERWIRPIKSILCILNGEVIPISFGGIVASNVTYGHRFFSNGKSIIVKASNDYFDFLEKNNIILEKNKRKDFILSQINKFAQEHNLQLEKNEYLLSELTGLVESPIVLFGRLNQDKSAQLPREVILSIMYTQQKYLALSDGEKIVYFATVGNVNNKNVISGYEKVLEARLADAQFLISQDKKHTLDYYVNRLDLILFHSSLGSMKEKVKRILALSKYIAIWIPNASLTKIERTAYLAKADLATSIVREFPELQGVMGGHYAAYFQEDHEVVESIIDHHKPLGPEQKCPKYPSAIAVSLADKMDTLVGLIGKGEKISGSYDPFGLRRISIGIIRIILENELRIPIKTLIEKSISFYSRLIFPKYIILIDKSSKLGKKQILEVVFKFCLERLNSILKNRNIRPGVIDSILYKDASDFLMAEEQIMILNNYLLREEGEQILSTYKRISNIINKAEKTDRITYSSSYGKRFLLENEEIELSNHFITSTESIKQAIKNNHFNVALDELIGCIPLVNHFMDNVKINCESDELRKNRLSLIVSIIYAFHLVADFSLIQTK